MADRTDGSWPVCEMQGCAGAQLAPETLCLAHATGPRLDAALNRVGATGEIDARGVHISTALLEQVLAAAPWGSSDTPLFRGSRFDGATFDGDAVFGRVTFEGPTSFYGATFSGDASFLGTTFSRDANFAGATFSGDARFLWATFSDDAVFHRVTFSRYADFVEATLSGHTRFGGATFSGITMFRLATFSGEVTFGGATFSDIAMFSGATFSGDAHFFQATFSGMATFGGATFSRTAMFDMATFADETSFGETVFHRAAVFRGARFVQAHEFGPVLAHRGLVLDGAEFAQPVQIEASAMGVCCRGARFLGGVQFRLRWARVVLDDADFPAPSILTGIPRLSSEKLASREERIVKAWQRLLAGEISEQPQLLSLIRANVVGLGLSNVTVADCRFVGAHNLDKMRLEADVSFGLAPAPLGWLSWEGRQVIAEERDWRAGRSRPWGWRASWWPGWLGSRPDVLDTGQIAGLYRALRKGREDIKDEPGAADFYYGEMEMRRRARLATGSNIEAASRGRAERAVLAAYWLVSGYSLRAWRALACLAVITALFAVAFHFVGFAKPPQPVSYWTSLLYAFRATLSLTDSNVELTAWGQLLQGLLRLTGPVLLGLALLALRGRVKR